jgi:hypothetical protein
MRPDPGLPALIAEATKRAGLVWITVPGPGRPRAAWHVWPSGHGAAYVLTGPGEQAIPGLAGADRVTVTVASKDSGGQLIAWTAQVSQVGPDSAEWGSVARALVAGRLNAAPEPGNASPARRWARSAAVYRLTPVVDATGFDAAGLAP